MRVSELFEATLVEGFAIKLKDGTWYSEQRPTLGPVRGGNAQIRVFKSQAEADDFLIMQQNKRTSSKRFEDAEIKRAPKLTREGAEFGAYYYEQLAKKLPAGLKGDALDKAGFEQAVTDLGKKRAQSYFYGDEDFRSDFHSAYNWWQKNKDTVKEAVNTRAWRAQVRKDHGSNVKFWDDEVHNRVIAKLGDEIVGRMDLKSGSATVFAPKKSTKMAEGVEKKLEDAIKMNWMSWSVERIVKQLKRSNWPELKGKSDQEIEDLVDDAMYQARNQLGEASAGKGMWVIKNKDGQEKRFKDDESPEAVAWKNSSSPKKAPKVALYSKEYWEKKEDDGAEILPWTRIKGDEAAVDKIENIVKDQFGNITYDWTLQGYGERDRDGVPCAITKVRVSYEIKPEDDLGVDKPTSDAQAIYVGRNPKNPKKLDFLGFTH